MIDVSRTAHQHIRMQRVRLARNVCYFGLTHPHIGNTLTSLTAAASIYRVQFSSLVHFEVSIR